MATVHRVCPFCEATCGLAIEVVDGRVTSVRGDKADPFSRGFICPKAYGVKELHHDPDRLRKPVRRTATGWQEISWQEAFDLVGERLLEIRKAHGNDAIGTYTGNPVVHDLGAVLYRPVLRQALATKSQFNSAAIDTLPKIVQTGLMFGRPFPMAVPVPDVDRTQHLLIIGANPMISHGSLMTMPDAPRRLRGVLERGGKIVVIDPRRTETAKMASEHHFIRPGSDAAFLLALVHTLFEEELADLGAARELVLNLDVVRTLAKEFTPEAVAAHCGIAAAEIRRIARELAAAESAACYGRLGTCVQEFGTLASWGVDLVNILSGNLDRAGGVMFTTPAAPLDAVLPRGKGFEVGRWTSRVGGHPEVDGLIPSSAMAEEILTPGPGQVRAMILLMTNPLRSAANSGELERAFRSLDFLVAIDFYINETTRHAHVILPAPAAAEQNGYEVGLYLLAVRNVAKWSQPIGELGDTPETWQIFSEIGARMLGIAHLPRQAIDDIVFRRMAEGAVASNPQWSELTVDEILAKVDGGIGPARVVDLLLRVGPHGDGFGRRPGRAHPGGAEGGSARDRPGPARAAPARGDQHRERPDRSRAAAHGRRPRPAARAHGGAPRRRPLDRPPRHARQQFVHAQPAGAREGEGPLHPARLAAGRGARRPRARRLRAHHEPGRNAGRAGRGHRRPHAGRRQPAPRLGPRCARRAAADRQGAPGREHQRADRQPGL